MNQINEAIRCGQLNDWPPEALEEAKQICHRSVQAGNYGQEHVVRGQHALQMVLEAIRFQNAKATDADAAQRHAESLHQSAILHRKTQCAAWWAVGLSAVGIFVAIVLYLASKPVATQTNSPASARYAVSNDARSPSLSMPKQQLSPTQSQTPSTLVNRVSDTTNTTRKSR